MRKEWRRTEPEHMTNGKRYGPWKNKRLTFVNFSFRMDLYD
jgi:hypothetical protein